MSGSSPRRSAADTPPARRGSILAPDASSHPVRLHVVSLERVAAERFLTATAQQRETWLPPQTGGENLAARMGRWSAQHRKKAIWGWLAFVIARVRDRRRGRDRDAGHRPERCRRVGARRAHASTTPSRSTPASRCSSRAAPRPRLTRRSARWSPTFSAALPRCPTPRASKAPTRRAIEGQISRRRALRPASLRDRRRRGSRPRTASARRWTPQPPRRPPTRTSPSSSSATRAPRSSSTTRSATTSSRRSSPRCRSPCIILLIAFGALVAASVPLLLALTAVLATIGIVGLISHISPRRQLDQRGDPADRARGRRRLLDVLPAPRARGARVGAQRRGLAGGRGGDLGPGGARLRASR